MALLEEGQRVHQRFAGLRNNVGVGEFAPEDLAVAINVDLNDAGVLQRRKGYSAPVVEGAFHSLWAGAGVCLAVTGTSLVRVLPDYSTQALRADMATGRRVSYVAVGARVYYSNGAQTGVVDAGASRSWGLVPPPMLAASAVAGSLRLGRVQFALTYVRTDGQESGATRAGILDLTAGGGLQFTGLPVSDDPDVLTKVLYVSQPDGDTLLRFAEIAADETVFAVRERSSSVAALSTQFLRQPPPGDIVAYFGGSTLVAAGSRLFMSEPYAPELFDWRKSLAFGSTINMVAPVSGGVFVGTEDVTVFLAGTLLDSLDYREVADYGVIPGTAVRVVSDDTGADAGTSWMWFSRQGLCAGADRGQFKNITRERYSFPTTGRGAALYRRHRGFNQVLTVLQGTETVANEHI